MLSVAALYDLPSSAVGTLVRVGGVLLGAKFDNLKIADSIEDYDRGIAVPILDDDLYERMFNRGVTGIGGGRFGFRFNCTIEAKLAPGARGYNRALTNLVAFTVTYFGEDVVIIPANE